VVRRRKRCPITFPENACRCDRESVRRSPRINRAGGSVRLNPQEGHRNVKLHKLLTCTDVQKAGSSAKTACLPLRARQFKPAPGYVRRRPVDAEPHSHWPAFLNNPLNARSPCPARRMHHIGQSSATFRFQGVLNVEGPNPSVYRRTKAPDAGTGVGGQAFRISPHQADPAEHHQPARRSPGRAAW
jgi:hypothetical protein